MQVDRLQLKPLARFGETDLPTRLRIELEASDASRQAAVAKINYAVAISNLRQALGLLPE